MKALWSQLLITHLLCFALLLLMLHLVFTIQAERTEEAQFYGTGQILAKSLAHNFAAANALSRHTHAHPVLSALPETPGLFWTSIITRDGHILAHTGAQPLPTTFLEHLNSQLPWAEIPPSRNRQACTVFQSPVPTEHPGTLAYVALNRVQFQQSAFFDYWRVLSYVAVAFVIILGFYFIFIGMFLKSLRLIAANACRIQRAPQAAPHFDVFPATYEITSLRQALNNMVLAVWQHNSQLRRDFAQMRLSEAQYRSVFENAVHGIWQATPDGHYICLNPAMASLYGYPSAEILRTHLEGNSSASVYVSSQRRAEFLRLMQQQGWVTGFESQIQRGDGGVIWISETVRTIRNEASGICYWEGTVEDITAPKHVEADRSHLASHLRLLMEASGEGIYGIDARGNCTYINAVGAQMLGYEIQDVMGRNMHALVHHSHADHTLYPEARSYLYQSLQTGQRFRVDHEVLWRRDGSSFPAEYTTAPLTEGGRTTGAVVTFVDISARKAIEAEQQRLLAEALERADHDPLTSLLNHRAFHKRLHEESDRAQRDGSSLAVALLDIDNFKFFNDVYGHKVGDEVLCIVANALRGSSRSYDILARYGGDEFAILMPCDSEETSITLTARLSERLSGVSYQLPDHDIAIPLGLSLGVAIFPIDVPTRVDALELADDRLRRSKTGGDEDGYAERVRNAITYEREGFTMLDALVTAVDNKDRYTRRHSEDVMRYSGQIAQELGLDQAMQNLVEIAALIHDVGKIGVPDAILRKPGQLTDQEFAAIQQHPIMGAVIAESVPGFEETLDAIRHHHERWDGAGYPAKLAGEDIPFIARLMAVADAYSAMTTDRPYRKGMDKEKSLGILERGAGIQWDPQCVAAFLRSQKLLTAEATLPHP